MIRKFVQDKVERIITMYFLEVSGIRVTTHWQPNKKQSEHASKRQNLKKIGQVVEYNAVKEFLMDSIKRRFSWFDLSRFHAHSIGSSELKMRPQSFTGNSTTLARTSSSFVFYAVFLLILLTWSSLVENRSCTSCWYGYKPSASYSSIAKSDPGYKSKVRAETEKVLNLPQNLFVTVRQKRVKY